MATALEESCNDSDEVSMYTNVNYHKKLTWNNTLQFEDALEEQPAKSNGQPPSCNLHSRSNPDTFELLLPMIFGEYRILCSSEMSFVV